MKKCNLVACFLALAFASIILTLRSTGQRLRDPDGGPPTLHDSSRSEIDRSRVGQGQGETVDGLAYVTLISSLEYDIGAQLLVCRLRHFSPDIPIYVLVDDSVKLKSTAFYAIMRAELIQVANPAGFDSSLRTEVRTATYTKLHVWQLDNIEKAVYLDADTLPVQNPDILFSMLPAGKTFAAVAGHPGHFNSGVFAYRPSNSTYRDLIQRLNAHNYTKNKANPTEQDLLVSHFAESDQTVFIDDRFNFAPRSYNRGLHNDTVIIHYTGNPKPWTYMLGKMSSIEGHFMDSVPGAQSGRYCMFGSLFCSHLPEWSIQLYMNEVERYFSHCHDPEPQ